MKNTAENLSKDRTLTYFKQIFDLLEIGIHGVDPEGRTIFYNSAMAQLEDQRVEDVLGKLLLEAMPHLSNDQSTLMQVLKLGRSLPEKQQTYINAKGRQIITVNRNLPIFIDGKIAGALEMAKDITQVQVLSECLIDLHEGIAKKDRNKAATLSVRYSFDDIIGTSEEMKELIKEAKLIARSASPVLIVGETGTGKELFAQSIHRESLAANGPFIGINCAALPEQLLEGLLFGTVKGSFTDAIDRPGLFEQAHRGTLLLDEINSMPVSLQSKLLRVLEEKRIRRVGDTKEQAIEVRILATMNQDPWELIEKNELREDLFYRVSVHTLSIPPLRERPKDIFAYTQAFLNRRNKNEASPIVQFSSDVESAFLSYPWPGNVRQLEHVLEGALAFMDESDLIKWEHLPGLFRRQLQNHRPTQQQFEEPTGLDTQKNELEKELIIQALKDSQGNISQAARFLGISRQLLQYKIRQMKKANNSTISVGQL